MEREKYDFNLEKVASLRRAKCNSEEICKKKYIYLIDQWVNSNYKMIFLQFFVFPLIYLINATFFNQSLQNYISLGVSELFFPNCCYVALSVKKTVTPEPYGSNSMDLKDLRPPLLGR